MAVISGAAKVIMTEADLSTRVGAIAGALGAMVIPAVCGPLTPTEYNSPTQLLNALTPNGKVLLGYDDAYFQALAYLQYSNRLLVTRAVGQGCLCGGHFFTQPNSTTPSNMIEFGINDGTNYDISTVDGTLNGVTPAAGEEKSLLIYGSDPGVWNNQIGIVLISDQSKVKEPNAFLIYVYFGNNPTPVESFLVSLDPNKKDLRSNSLFVETVLAQSSNYIRALTNAALNPALVDGVTANVKPTGTVPVTFGMGTDGAAVQDGDMINALNLMNNKDKYKPILISDSGWCNVEYQQAIISFCDPAGGRGDCAFIFAFPFSVESAGSGTNIPPSQSSPVISVGAGSSTSTNAASEAVQACIEYLQSELMSTSNYGGIFTPYLEVFDEMNNRNLFIAPSGMVAGKYAQIYDLLNPWQPVAGNINGTLNILGLYLGYSDADGGDMDNLYDANINPIRFTVGSGVRIWGQKTLQTRPSDLDRMNCRMTLLALEPPIRKLLENYLFSLNNLDNSSGTRLMIKAVIENFLSPIKLNKGLYDYKVICNSTNNSATDIDDNILRVWVLVKLPKSIEWIPLTIGITATSMDFSVAQSLL